MIELKNISKAYKTRTGLNQVVSDLSFTFEDKVSVGILGRNGSGKSTLLRMIGRIEMPDSGEIIRNSRVSWPIAFGGGNNPKLTGRENTRFVSRIYDADEDEVVSRALEFSELGDYFDMQVRTYSMGMRARLAFGISMAIDFDTYLIDEATAVGDQHFKRKCKLAFDEKRDKSSVIIVSHQINTIKEFSDSYAVLKEGKLIAFDSLDDAAKLYNTV